MKYSAPYPSHWTQGYVPATANAVRNGLLSLSSRESGGFRSAMEAAKEMMQEVYVAKGQGYSCLAGGELSRSCISAA